MDIRQEIENSCIRIDWKNSISDTYYSMIHSWNHLSSILSDSKFKELIENYNSETPTDYLPAIGQELTVHDFLLYNINEDADHYCLVAIPISEKKTFELETKKSTLTTELQKQTRKKIGVKATRIKLANQLPHNKYTLKGVSWLKYPLTYSNQRQFTNGAKTGEKNFIVDLSELPPSLIKSEKITALEYNENNGLYAAVFADTETKQGYVRLTKTPLDSNSWQEVESQDELPGLCKLGWIDNTLLIIREKEVWKFEYQPNKSSIITHLFSSKDESSTIHGTFPNFIKTNSNEHYVLLFTQFYHWSQNKLIPTGVYAKEHTDFNFKATRENSIVYISKGKLVELDFNTRKFRTREIPNLDFKTTVRTFDQNWAVILRWGNIDKSYPIATFWNPVMDEWRAIKLGTIGKFGIRDIVKVDNDKALILGTEETLIELTSINNIFLDEKYLVRNDSQWSEDWNYERKPTKSTIESEANKKSWIKRIFKS